VDSFPDWEDLGSKASDSFSEINEDEPWEAYEAAVKSLGGETEFCTLVGGYADWVQGTDTPVCDHCQSRMNLLAQIDSEPEADVMWGDSGLLYLFYCDNHPRDVRLLLQCF
jgi:uncharacterized protein YwqG